MYPKISIIIPVYNAEKNIEKCLDSIIKQTYSNLEIICINDGSVDNSENLIKDIQKKDSRVILFSKKNSGVSDTRNYGIEQSTGEYIMFIDADDYIDTDYIEKMVELAEKEKCGLVISNYTELKNNKYNKVKILDSNDEFRNITYPNVLDDYLLTYKYNSCWKQLIKNSLIKNHNIKFNKLIKYGEDMLFSFECYKYSKRTYYIRNYGYYYYINDGSVMNRKSLDALLKYMDDNKNVSDIIIDNSNLSKKQLSKIKYKTNKTLNSIFSNMINCSYSYRECKKIIKNELKKNKIYLKGFDYFKYSTINQKIAFLLLKVRFIKIYYLLKK